MNRFNHLKSFSTILFSLLLIVLVSFEFIASSLAYENYSWDTEEFLFLAIFFNIIPILLYIFKKRIVSIVFLIVIGVFIIPKQFITSKKLCLLKEESANIVNYVYNVKLEKGEFPKNISEYEFKYPELKDNFSYLRYDDKNNFQVEYHVGTENTSHFYSHNTAPYWNYYAD